MSMGAHRENCRPSGDRATELRAPAVVAGQGRAGSGKLLPWRGPARSSGLSLLEVILALSILGIAMATIGELMRVGVRNAEAARDLTTAQLLAESLMSQVVSGMMLPEPQGTTPVDDPQYQYEWVYSVDAQPVGQDGLLSVRITVGQDPAQFARPVSYELVRWMVDPQVLADLEAEAYAAEQAAYGAETGY